VYVAATSTQAPPGSVCVRCGRPAGTRLHILGGSNRDVCLVCGVVLATRWRELGGGVDLVFHPGTEDRR
jgi:hypothetical protein